MADRTRFELVSPAWRAGHLRQLFTVHVFKLLMNKYSNLIKHIIHVLRRIVKKILAEEEGIEPTNPFPDQTTFEIVPLALEMSVSPRQNFLKPPPVPEMPTVTLTRFLVATWKSSATALVIGNTVELPSILTVLAGTAAASTTPASARMI